MDESEMENDDNHEIRLLALLATIIRHRAWVLWTTGTGTLAALIILIVLPQFGISLAGAPTLTLEATVRVVVVPAEAQASLNFDVSALIQAQSSNLGSVGEIYRATMETNHDATLGKAAFNRVIRTFIDRSFRVYPDNRSASVYLTLKVNESDQEKGAQFLDAFIKKIANDVKVRTSAQIVQAISNLELSGKPGSELAAQARAPYEIASRALKGVLSNPDFPLSQVGGIEALEDEGRVSRGVLMFVACFGSLFVGVILAFAVDAINRTRRDPQSVELLRRAWRGE